MAVNTKEPEMVKFYITRMNGELIKGSQTIYFPFSEYEKGYSAAERQRTPESEAMDIVFQDGFYETSDPLWVEILTNYHDGTTITTRGNYHGMILRPKPQVIFKISTKSPENISITETKVKEVVVEKIPRVLVQAADATVLATILKQKGITVPENYEKDQLISIMEEQKLISD